MSNHTTTPVALEHEIRKEHIHIFEENGVLSERELKARSEIKFEKYVKLFVIEAQVLADIVRNYVLPAAFRYQTQLIENVKGLKEIYGKDFESIAKSQSHLITVLSGNFSEIDDLLVKLDYEKKKALAYSEMSETAKAFSEHIRPLLEAIRAESDALEMITKDAFYGLF